MHCQEQAVGGLGTRDASPAHEETPLPVICVVRNRSGQTSLSFQAARIEWQHTGTSPDPYDTARRRERANGTWRLARSKFSVDKTYFGL